MFSFIFSISTNSKNFGINFGTISEEIAGLGAAAPGEGVAENAVDGWSEGETSPFVHAILSSCVNLK